MKTLTTHFPAVLSRKSRRFLSFLLLLAIILSCFQVPAYAAGHIVMGGKVSLKKSTSQGTDDGWNFSIGLPHEKTKLTKKMTYSMTWLVPASFIPKGNRLKLVFMLDLADPKTGENLGMVPASDDFFLTNTDGKVRLERKTFDEKKMKVVKKSVGSLATLKKAGSYYVVSIKNAPIGTICFPDHINLFEFKNINTTKNYSLSANALLYGGEDCTIKKALSGYVFLDGISVKASRTEKVSIEDMNYRWFTLTRNVTGAAGARKLRYIDY